MLWVAFFKLLCESKNGQFWFDQFGVDDKEGSNVNQRR